MRELFLVCTNAEAENRMCVACAVHLTVYYKLKYRFEYSLFPVLFIHCEFSVE